MHLRFPQQLLKGRKQKSLWNAVRLFNKEFDDGARQKAKAYVYMLPAAAAGILAFGSVVWFKKKYTVVPSNNKNAVDCSSRIHATKLVSGDNVDLRGRERPTLHEAIQKARHLIQCLKDEVGTPGIVVGVSVDGQTVWKEGFGFSNVENQIPCSSETVMRIASISKSLTATAAAKLWEESKLDFDKPVQYYVPSFPDKMIDGETVTITPKHLISHMGGIRHYKAQTMPKDKLHKKEEKITDVKKAENDKNEKDTYRHDSSYFEFLIKDKFDSVADALKLFQDEPLKHRPGSKFLYTTHGFTLLSAVIEGASKSQFPILMKKMFHTLGLHETYCDENEPLIPNRSSYYERKGGRLINAPYVDNSYKWAGGGFLSTVGDLLQFGNAMLYSYQYDADCDNRRDQTCQSDNQTSLTDHVTSEGKKDFPEHRTSYPGFLKRDTMKMLWTPVVQMPQKKGNKEKPLSYGMGWTIAPECKECEFCHHQILAIAHTGGAMGASSVLLIMPRENKDEKSLRPPQGTIVTMITNLTNVQLYKEARKIATLFNEL